MSVRRVARTTLVDGTMHEEVILGRGEGAVPGTLLRPEGSGPHPAILYCHAHGNAFDIGRSELLQGRPALREGPWGPVLARAGFVVLCLDMPGHGERRAEGDESALAKAALWRGETLLGRMLADLTAGLEALLRDPGVAPDRIGAMGLSMGATHAYWLAALDERVAAVVHLCAFADMGPLIATGGHDLHGIYMSVPGLLQHGDMGDVAAMIAPRPQLIAWGGRDPLTPEAATQPALARVRAAYRDADAAEALRIVHDAQAEHEETPQMRTEILAFLTDRLGTRRRGVHATSPNGTSPGA